MADVMTHRSDSIPELVLPSTNLHPVMEYDSAEVRDWALIAEHIDRAKRLLNRFDPMQGAALAELERAEARLRRLSSTSTHGD